MVNKFITKCSISLVISEIQSKTTIIISTLTGMTETKSKKEIPSFDKNVEKLDILSFAIDSINYSGEHFTTFLCS